ncbi:NAD(P)/FAD-dependent oxidoreductase [Actinomadura graeca]|uniref:NAD(P)/FAD-dependent oxidoreductase n=1 Tax=Actinomadura graeca TaxID=2750812 RepID=A0ABX8QR58_9ACTN|nr:NAD(P)/FAD-dependent oxidoreductase [Actinomadura graeca]QXJ21284.1 NAD(P)/FAD-dependent oxidoreductase [Actinomadura graeca]
MADECDVVVIGGGAAGLSGALMLARARRSVVVIDAGEPRNAPAEGVHGLLGLDGTRPGELLERGREEVRGYGGRILRGTVRSVARVEGWFVVERSVPGGVGGRPPTSDRSGGAGVRARRVLVTTGLADELPDVPGLRDRWGRDVLHCPYCHGWEVRDRAIGVLGGGPFSVHQALLFRQWSDDIVYFSHTAPPDGEQAEELAARGVRVVDGKVESLEVTGDRLAGVRPAGGDVVARDALVVSPRMVARAGFLEGLGLRPVEHPSGAGTHVPADAAGRTEVPGVWVAGNVTDLMAQVGAAAAAGALAAVQINADLVAEETRDAVARRGFSAASEARNCERVLGDRRHGL